MDQAASIVDQLQAYLTVERGIPLDVLRACRVTISRHKGEIGFPYRLSPEDEQPLSTKWRTLDKRFRFFPAGVPLIPWGLDGLQSLSDPSLAETLVITEGEIDRMSCMAAGWMATVSVPSGAPAKMGEGPINPSEDRAFAYLWNEAGELRYEFQNARKIILCTDNDKPGEILRAELGVRLGAKYCWCVVYPDGCKDANDVLVKLGPEALDRMLREAVPLVPDRLVSISQVPIRTNQERYLSGWPDLDENLILSPPELVVVTGRPGDGKSQWAFNWMLNLCRLYGLNGAVVQFEDDVERTRNDLLRYCANNKLTANWADEHVKVVLPCEDEEDVRDFAWIKELIKEAVERHNAKIVILDPWNEIEHLWDAKQNGADQLNHALRDLKKLARQYQIALVIVAHPDKSSGINQSVDEMSLYSINGGAAWKNKADHGIVVSREHDETGRPVGPVTWVKIDKSKNHERMGVPGKKKLIFDTATREYLGEGGEVT